MYVHRISFPCISCTVHVETGYLGGFAQVQKVDKCFRCSEYFYSTEDIVLCSESEECEKKGPKTTAAVGQKRPFGAE